MDTVTMVKPGILELQIGSGVIRKLQEALNFIIKDLSKEDIVEYSELFKKGTNSDDYPKEWMKHAHNLSFLIKVCEDAAVAQELTYQKNIDADYTSIDDFLKEEDN